MRQILLSSFVGEGWRYPEVTSNTAAKWQRHGVNLGSLAPESGPLNSMLYTPSWSIVGTPSFILFPLPSTSIATPHPALPSESWQAKPHLQHPGSLSLWLPVGLGQCKELAGDKRVGRGYLFPTAILP